MFSLRNVNIVFKVIYIAYTYLKEQTNILLVPDSETERT